MAKTIYVDGSISNQRSPVTTSTGMGRGTAAEPYENIFQIAASELDSGGNNVINVAGDIYVNKQTVGATNTFNFIVDATSGNQNIFQQWAGKAKARLIQAYRLDNNPDFQWVGRSNGEFSLHPSGAGNERAFADINYQDTATVNGYYRTKSVTVPLRTSAERQMAGSRSDADRSLIGVLNELDIGTSESRQITNANINTSTETLTSDAHRLVEGDELRYKAPVGGSAMQISGSVVAFDTQFFVIAAGLTANAFRISTTKGGSTVDITNAGSGTHFFGQSGFPVETPFFKPESGKTPDDYEIYLGTGKLASGGNEASSYFSINKDFWTIEGITFYHGSRSNFSIGAQTGLIMQKCVFANSESYGIEMSTSTGSQTSTIRNNIFSNNGTNFQLFNAQSTNTINLENNVFHRSNGVMGVESARLAVASANGTGSNALTIVLPSGHTVVAGKKVLLEGFINGSSSGTVINGQHTVASVSTNTVVVTVTGVTASDNGNAVSTDSRKALPPSKTAINFKNNLCVMQDEFIKFQSVDFNSPGAFNETNNYFYLNMGSQISHTGGNFNQTNNNTSNTSYPPAFAAATALRGGNLASKFKGSRILGDPPLPNPVVHLDPSDYYKCDFHPTPESFLIMGGTASGNIAQGEDFEGIYFGASPNIGIYQTSSDGNPNGTARTPSVVPALRIGGKTLPRSIFAPLIAATVSETQSHNIRLKPFEEIEVQVSKRLAKGEFVSASNGTMVIGRGEEFGVVKNVTGIELNLIVTKSVTRTPVSVTYS